MSVLLFTCGICLIYNVNVNMPICKTTGYFTEHEICLYPNEIELAPPGGDCTRIFLVFRVGVSSTFCLISSFTTNFLVVGLFSSLPYPPHKSMEARPPGGASPRWGVTGDVSSEFPPPGGARTFVEVTGE